MNRQFVLGTARIGFTIPVGRRALLLGLALAAGTLALLIMSIAFGEFTISPMDVLRVLSGGGSRLDRAVVIDTRLPRALGGVMAGAALGAAGAIFQAVARNPLVSPDTVGINSGAACGVMLIIASGGPFVLFPLGALAGAVVSALLVYGLAWWRGLDPGRLVLVGVGIGALGTVAVSYWLTSANISQIALASVWLLGSLYQPSITATVITAGLLIAILPTAPAITRQLSILELGDDCANSLGGRAGTTRTILVAVGCLLAAAAVAIVGPIAFIAFVSPHIARMLVREPPALLVIPSALVAAFILTAADQITKRLASPTELPVGVVSIIFGAPYFLILLSRLTRRGLRR